MNLYDCVTDDTPVLSVTNKNVNEPSSVPVTNENENESKSSTGSACKRNRKPRIAEWKKTKLAAATLQGLEHINSKRKVIPKKLPVHIDCKCKFHCHDKISKEQQDVLFADYRSLSRIEQRNYLYTLVIESVPQRKTVPDDKLQKGKSVSIAYHLPKGQYQTRVCARFFCSTFGISQKIPLTIVKKRSPVTHTYKGTHGLAGKKPPNTTPHFKVREVVMFFSLIPKLPSHYCRAGSRCLYFEAGLTMRKLYSLYEEHISPSKPVSFYVFVSIFKDQDPPLKFYKPKKDQCVICNNTDGVYEKPDPFGYPFTVAENHILRKDIIKVFKDLDKEFALKDKERVIYGSYDLEATLNLPHSEDSPLYYARKLNVYNFTIWDSRGDGICNYWPETEGKKGSNEIATCLLQYFEGLPETIEHVILYSDTCAGQNRNQFMAATLMYAINCPKITKNIQILDMNYMESGHSHMECDSMHSRIEQTKKNMKLYSLEEIEIIFKAARKNPRPYVVKKFDHSQFLNAHDLGKNLVTNRVKDTTGNVVNWLRIKCIRYLRGSPVLLFKYEPTDENFLELKLSDIAPDELENFITPSKAYPEQLPISIAKKRDLLQLMKKGAIPQIYSNFYSALPSSKKVKDEAVWVRPCDIELMVVEEEIEE